MLFDDNFRISIEYQYRTVPLTDFIFIVCEKTARFFIQRCFIIPISITLIYIHEVIKVYCAYISNASFSV